MNVYDYSPIRLPIVLMVACVYSSASAPPVWAAGDPARGHTLAQTWCSSCHTIERGGTGKDSAPPFASIAARGKPEQREARTFLNAPHPPMPNFNLARSEIDDIVAYLNSLAN